jgi:CHAT domain-containing protein
MTKEEKDEERRLKSELLALNAQVLRERDDARRIYLKARLEKVRRDYDTFLQSTVYAVHPELQAQRGESEPTTVVQAAQWLRAQKMRDVVVLEYVVWDKQTWLFAFNETGKVKVYPVNLTIEPLRKQVEALQAAIRLKEEGKQGSLPPIETALRQLDSVLAPAAPLLSKAKQVCIIPDDALWEVPFAALKTPDGKYLIERCAVFYAPSVTALKAMAEKDKQQRARPSVQLLAMAPFATSGNRNAQSTRQVTARGTFGTLPASLDEVKTISSMFSAKPYLREAATETRAKAGLDKARILHFATHGLFEPSQGMYSGLVLANEKGEDGYWEAWEIAQSQSKANLAVLSACETARGQLSRGEGIIGLSWAFFVAGCPSTVVSQWKVRDASTAELMKSFYQNLKKGMNKAESLRQAQLSLLRSNTTWRHPFYWSPFILVGNWQ